MKKKRNKFAFWSRGHTSDTLLMMCVVIGSIIIAGVFFTINKPGVPAATGPSLGGICCDSGDGTNCHPLNDSGHVITFNNPRLGTQTYGLLKSGIKMDHPCHLTKTDQLFNGDPIILNSTEKIQGECGGGNGIKDQIDTGGSCVPIPDDEILYVCRSNCYDTPDALKQQLLQACTESYSGDISKVVSYGDNTTVFDLYMRLSDYPNPGVPQPIAFCGPFVTNGPSATGTPFQRSIMTPVAYPTHHSEQLHQFQFDTPTPFLSHDVSYEPWCKPAIYLYPPQTESVHVEVNPKGPLTYTIPAYPTGGWVVSASPDGTISYKDKTYPYLYYETKISDSLLSLPADNVGYVSAYGNLPAQFAKMLPQLGLNAKESDDFTKYWIKALPKSPYYFVSVVPQETLDNIASLTINPTPDSILRVTLYFQPLDKPVTTVTPVISPFARGNFHVTEWGGMYKKDKNHPFTCLQ